jgi:TolC family type I secretion outer membrane protein
MFKKKIRVYAIISLICSVGTISYAQSSSSSVLELNLETAQQIALENNPSVKLAREGVLKSKAQVTETRAGMLPTLSVFSQAQHAWELPTMVIDFPGMGKQKFKMGTENTVVAGLSIDQPLFVGGAIWSGYQMAKIGADVSVANLETTENSVIVKVTEAYYGVLFANSSVEVAEQALESAEENLEQVKKFFEVGKSSQFDVLRAEVQVSNYKPMVVSAKNQQRLAESNLRMILGIDNEAEFLFTDELEFTETYLTEIPLEELIEIAINDRPEILIMNKQEEMFEKQVSVARASFMPSLFFSTSLQHQALKDEIDITRKDFYRSSSSSLSLSIPIFSGFKNSANLQKAKIAVKESGHQKESLYNGIELEVKAAYFKLKESEENVSTQQKTIEQAREAKRLAELMYSEGASTQLDVLNANLALNQALMNYQKSLFDYNVALANLKKATNQL